MYNFFAYTSSRSSPIIFLANALANQIAEELGKNFLCSHSGICLASDGPLLPIMLTSYFRQMSLRCFLFFLFKSGKLGLGKDINCSSVQNRKDSRKIIKFEMFDDFLQYVLTSEISRISFCKRKNTAREVFSFC